MNDPIVWLTGGLLVVTFAYMLFTWRSTTLMKDSVSYQAAADRLAVLPLIGIEIVLVEEELFDMLHNREALCTIRLVNLRDIAPVNIFASVRLRIRGEDRGIRWRSQPVFPFIRSGAEVVFQRYLGLPFAELVEAVRPWATTTGGAVSHPRIEVEILYRNHWKRKYRSVQKCSLYYSESDPDYPHFTAVPETAADSFIFEEIVEPGTPPNSSTFDRDGHKKYERTPEAIRALGKWTRRRLWLWDHFLFVAFISYIAFATGLGVYLMIHSGSFSDKALQWTVLGVGLTLIIPLIVVLAQHWGGDQWRVLQMWRSIRKTDPIDAGGDNSRSESNMN